MSRWKHRSKCPASKNMIYHFTAMMLNMRCWCRSNQLITLADSKEWRVSSVWTWRWCTGTLTSSGEHWRWWGQQSAPSPGPELWPVWPTPGCNWGSNSSFIIHCLPTSIYSKIKKVTISSSAVIRITFEQYSAVVCTWAVAALGECALWNVIHPWTDSTYMQPGLASLACLYSAAGVHQYLHYFQYISRRLHLYKDNHFYI